MSNTNQLREKNMRKKRAMLRKTRKRLLFYYYSGVIGDYRKNHYDKL